jgi:Tfp pilus assembly protein PilF
MWFRLFILLLAVAFLAACAAERGPARQSSENPAVLALLDTAHANADQGRIPAATAALERALRIEPRTPVLWHELAQLHLRAGNYPQAESFAARSNSWAGSTKALRAANWRLIGEARTYRGDGAGAQAAIERAGEFEN